VRLLIAFSASAVFGPDLAHGPALVPLDNTAQDHVEQVNFRNQRFRKWMRNLPDLEGLAIFAKVAEARSLTRAAEELGVSKATISKSLARLETRLGTTLLHRTSRLLSLTEAGRGLLDPALQMLAHAEAAESEALNQAASPRGVVRLAAPMSFGLSYVSPALPDFLSRYPEISVDLHLSDEVVDLVAGGFDVALRIAALQDSSLVARRLCHVERFLVGAPAYFARRGRPPATLGSSWLTTALPTPTSPRQTSGASGTRRGKRWRSDPAIG
jgi:DNA-binding transcriptional LysR family regulator